MEWTKALLKKHTDEDGKLNEGEFIKEYNKEFPKHAVPKDDFNNKNDELKQAQATIDKLQADHTDVEALQKTIEQHEQALKDQTKKYTVENALKDVGGIDVDYLKYKLGDVELNKDGSIKDLDNKLKALKESHPTFFTKDEETNDGKKGFRVLDNGLEDGHDKKLTKEQILAQYPGTKNKTKRIELLGKMEE